MGTLTLREKNDKVLELDDRLEEKLGKVAAVVKQVLGKIDPDGLLVFSQAHEIERLQLRCATLGFTLARIEDVREQALREFARLKGLGVDVNEEVIKAIRTCLVGKKPPSNGEGDNGR